MACGAPIGGLPAHADRARECQAPRESWRVLTRPNFYLELRLRFRLADQCLGISSIGSVRPCTRDKRVPMMVHAASLPEASLRMWRLGRQWQPRS